MCPSYLSLERALPRWKHLILHYWSNFYTQDFYVYVSTDFNYVVSMTEIFKIHY